MLVTYPADATERDRRGIPQVRDQPARGPRHHRGLPAHARPSRSRSCCSAPRWASPRWARSATCCGGGPARWPSPSRPTCCAGGSAPATTSATWPRARSTGSRSCTGCCARCGTARATIEGRKASPDRLNVELGGGVTMTLPLTPLGQASSWGSLLRAYELWALDDDDLHRRFCGQLMQELPAWPRRSAVAAGRAVRGDQGYRRGADRAARRHDEEAGGRPAVPARADARVLGGHPARPRSTWSSPAWSRPWPRTCASWRGWPDTGAERMTVEILRLSGLAAAEAETAASTLLDLRTGPRDLSKLLVLDDTAMLARARAGLRSASTRLRGSRTCCAWRSDRGPRPSGNCGCPEISAARRDLRCCG